MQLSAMRGAHFLGLGLPTALSASAIRRHGVIFLPFLPQLQLELLRDILLSILEVHLLQAQLMFIVEF